MDFTIAIKMEFKFIHFIENLPCRRSCVQAANMKMNERQNQSFCSQKLAMKGAEYTLGRRGVDSILVEVNCGTLGKDFLEEVMSKVGFEERLCYFFLAENQGKFF